MGRYFKIGMLGMMLVSGGFAILQLRKIAEVKKDLDAGSAPEEALDRLAASDKTGVLSKVVDAHRKGLSRVDAAGVQEAFDAAASGDPAAARALSEMARSLGGGTPGSGKPPPRPERAAALAPSKISVYGAGEAVAETGPGVAVLVDEKTGERIVLTSSRKPAARRRRPAMPAVPSGVSNALGIAGLSAGKKQRFKAYALMGGTLLGTVLLVLWARRRFR